jgi:hypothetical protein
VDVDQKAAVAGVLVDPVLHRMAFLR